MTLNHSTFRMSSSTSSVSKLLKVAIKTLRDNPAKLRRLSAASKNAAPAEASSASQSSSGISLKAWLDYKGAASRRVPMKQ